MVVLVVMLVVLLVVMLATRRKSPRRKSSWRRLAMRPSVRRWNSFHVRVRTVSI